MPRPVARLIGAAERVSLQKAWAAGAAGSARLILTPATRGIFLRCGGRRRAALERGGWAGGVARRR
jgi:ribosomal protein S5